MPEEETLEQKMRRLVGQEIINGLEAAENKAPYIGHAMRWLDGGGQKTAARYNNPVSDALERMAREAEAEGKLPPLSDEDDEATGPIGAVRRQ